MDDAVGTVFVLDVETTGLDGGPKDDVVQVGVAAADLAERTVRPAYSAIVRHDVGGWPLSKRRAWIFDNSPLTLERVRDAPRDLARVREDLARILEGGLVTSYNTGFDLDRFLFKAPWGLRGTFLRLPCIYEAATRARGMDGHLPLAVAAKPLGDVVVEHDAVGDAVLAGRLMLHMIDNGEYAMPAVRRLVMPTTSGDVTFTFADGVLHYVASDSRSRVNGIVNPGHARALSLWLDLHGGQK